MKRNILLTIAYDGRDFHGWQRQPGKRTVQGELEKTLSYVIGQQVTIDGTSRTDAGVHALGQRASLRGDFGIPANRIPFAVNNILDDIYIVDAEEVQNDFHARFDSVGKTYEYKINISDTPDLFQRAYEYQLTRARRHLLVTEQDGTNDFERGFQRMKKACGYLIGTYDCACFMAQGSFVPESTVKTIYDVTVTKIADDLTIVVTGSGFLYNMVRIIVGTLVDIGTGRIEPEDIAAMIASRDRTRAGHTAPPQGLYLKKIYYKIEDIIK
ncbi:MAG: tRNA pseudouridine(38-40) synthase TruA [Clostridiales Family XIII bacterium]|jgi:tRNA pseudouridine38-40 synthase|nr:tRNA pseudouridine(38-40) synthase TruA [Clostridiales Family XIII bacterium]